MMYFKKFSKLIWLVLLSCLFIVQLAFSQSYVLNNQTSFLEVHGTSSLHDWHVDAEEQTGKMKISNSDELEIELLFFSVVSRSLKSGKSGMDKNTYKALKADDYETIDFNLSSVNSIKLLSENYYSVSAIGKMSISGVTNSLPIDFKVKLKGNQILIDGEKSLLMTDYGISPPKALLGTIKTGDEIKIIFKAVFENKQ